LARGFFSQDTLSYASLSKAQYEAWKKVEQEWLSEKFQPFLKRKKVKLSCAGCSSAMVWLTLKRSEGVTVAVVTGTRKCGGEFEGKALEELTKLAGELRLPEEFGNSVLTVSLGLALKC
jgi:hypothetical protein